MIQHLGFEFKKRPKTLENEGAAIILYLCMYLSQKKSN